MKYSFIPSTDGTRWVVLSDADIPIFFIEKTNDGRWQVIDFTNVLTKTLPIQVTDIFMTPSIETAVSMIHDRLKD